MGAVEEASDSRLFFGVFSMTNATVWIESALGSPELTIVAVPAAFLLGALGAVASCCTLPAIGAIAGYSASSGKTDRNENFIAAMAFLAGTFLALIIAGVVAGCIGRMPAGVLGRYWKLVAGIASILFGASSLKLLPFRLPGISIPKRTGARGPLSAITFGLLVGGATTACSVTCNPLLAVFLGLSVLKGHALWGVVVLGAFAFGYGLPLAAALAGLSAGVSTLGGRKISVIVTSTGGIILVGLGLYFLATF